MPYLSLCILIFSPESVESIYLIRLGVSCTGGVFLTISGLPWLFVTTSGLRLTDSFTSTFSVCPTLRLFPVRLFNNFKSSTRILYLLAIPYKVSFACTTCVLSRLFPVFEAGSCVVRPEFDLLPKTTGGFVVEKSCSVGILITEPILKEILLSKSIIFLGGILYFRESE